DPRNNACPGHSMSPYLSQNTKNLIAALHSTPRPQAILEQTLKIIANAPPRFPPFLFHLR
ncbi:hypothetical protein, partial [Neorhizobium galegae]|uniref:hypothetical protein n=1 Tax=Neorhizobium galegae TaxID=399 RepID=UPI002034D25A